MSVKPIPEGFSGVTPYLGIKRAAEAIAFYKQAFGAEECMRLDMPDGSVGHAELLGDQQDTRRNLIDQRNLDGDFVVFEHDLSPSHLVGGPHFMGPVPATAPGSSSSCASTSHFLHPADLVGLPDRFGHVHARALLYIAHLFI